ncbi:glycosyltransferase family 4 protein [Xanthomarina sp.]|uniref:glycosyltransferase family 4 protein n=1 Tax=Xanthomarina sp. TaxID=1931211 RepID=UPI002CEA3EDE|nr:glycosyltransferase family 4 protein [Xanthomarina sp.]HLV39931.1 glycosyltransferase family 4 protein [Xanthomarina sp.]
MKYNQEKNKVIYAPIPLPPPFHGSNIMNAQVVNSEILNDQFLIKTFGISYNENSSNIGSFSLRKIFLIIKNFLIITINAFKRHDLVYYSPAIKGFAFYRDLLLLLPLKVFGKKIVIHLHGKGISEAITNKPINKLFYKLFFKNTSVICLSERLTYDIKDVFKGPIYIVNNGIEEVSYPERKPKVNTPTILFLSNFIESKGIFVLLEAAKQLKVEGCDFKLNLVGAPRGDIEKRIEDYISSHNLKDNIISIGPKYDEEKHTAFHEADIFVLPTEIETWGLVVNEAMQASLPVITTNEGALPDIIENNVSGFIIEKRSPKQLAEKLKLLIKDEALRIEMGKAGLKKYQLNYTSTIMENRMAEVFTEILK